MTIAVKTQAGQSDAGAYAIPLALLNPANADRFQAGSTAPIFERLRAEAPVHYTADSEYGLSRPMVMTLPLYSFSRTAPVTYC